jgi:hypothetical protein
VAEEIQIRGTGDRAKIRNPLGVVGLSLITIGIYFLFWWYYVNREMRDLGKARGRDLGQSPGNSVLAMALGWIIIVPPIVSGWRTSMRIQHAQETVGVQPTVTGPIIFILLWLIGPVGIWYAQSELNKVWEAERSGGAPQAIAGAQPAPVPAPQPAPEAPPQAQPPPEQPGA